MRLKSVTQAELLALKEHSVCRPCLEGKNHEEQPSLVFITDDQECPNCGPVRPDESINGALLYCFLQTLALDTMLRAH
jgi:hypothetical protein